MASTATTSDLVHQYLERVEELYADIQEWMSDRPGIKFLREETELNEEYPGRYTAQALKATQKHGPTLTFQPKGAYIIGARGRVDVQGALGSETLVWVEKDGPGIAFRESVDGRVESLRGRPLFPGVSQGWAWVDNSRRRLVHLDREVFFSKVVEPLSE